MNTGRNVADDGRQSSGALPIALACALTAACGAPPMPIPASPEAPRFVFADVTPAQWQRLSTRRFYFGHQSVGVNIMDGVTALLAANPGIPLQVVETRTLDSAAGPALYHGRLGQNGAPASKEDEFAAIVRSGQPSLGALKFCYLDVTGETNPDSLFADYRRRMTDLRARVPGLVIVHLTMPYTSLGGRKEKLLGKLRGRATSYDLNAIRNRYNALLLQAYAGREPVFDIARLESTRPDGSRASFLSGNDTVHYLAPELTDDGGHLNAAGKRRAAEEFLALLANLQ